MKNLLIFLILTISSCGAGVSDYTEDLSGNYEYWNEGEELNYIASHLRRIVGISWVKKYHDNGNYISVWQADSNQIFDYGKSQIRFKPNTYYPSDRFYITDIKNDTLLGPYEKKEFFQKAMDLYIQVEWQPKITNE